MSEIADYTIATFGIAQARRYRDGFRSAFERLLRMPELGSNAEDLGAGLRAIHHASHTIYYRREDQGILIVRILHQSMDAKVRFD